MADGGGRAVIWDDLLHRPVGFSAQSHACLTLMVPQKIIEIAGRRLTVCFLDQVHADLLAYAHMGSHRSSRVARRLLAEQIFRALSPWVLEDFCNARYVHWLARDYADLVDEAACHALRNGQDRVLAPIIIDSDLQTEYVLARIYGDLHQGDWSGRPLR